MTKLLKINQKLITFFYYNLIILSLFFLTSRKKIEKNREDITKTRTKMSIRYAKENDREKRERRRERERR